jgi:hypothetical protein
LALLKSSLESGDELATKDTTKYAYWQEEGIAGMDPAFTIGGKTAGGDYTMEVRMKKQVLPPSVQHGKEADSCAKMFGVSRDLEQGLGSGAE